MKQKINYIIGEVADQYMMDDNKRPWIIGFSGGKDSTVLLQLVWKALERLKDFHGIIDREDDAPEGGGSHGASPSLCPCHPRRTSSVAL